jgi:hypothetical protein
MNSPANKARTALAVATVGIALTAVAASDAAHSKTFRVYAVATRAQYVDGSDAVTRANYQNPFNVDSKKFIPTTKGKTATLPGNSAFFNFKLYSDSSLKHNIGSASYICTFNFNGNATCDAYYELNGGTLFASGPVDFSTLSATMAVTGGTDAYAGLNGQVASAGPGPHPGAKNESELDFQLLG